MRLFLFNFTEDRRTTIDEDRPPDLAEGWEPGPPRPASGEGRGGEGGG